MKQYTQLILSLLICLLLTTGLQAKGVIFFMDLCRYQDIEGKPYIEFYLSVDASSVNFVQVDDGFQAEVDVMVELTKGTEAVYGDRFNLMSMVLADTSMENRQIAFIHQGRVQLSPGDYELHISMSDQHNQEAKPSEVFNQFSIKMAKEKQAFHMSDVNFLSSFRKTTQETIYSKHGYDIIPFVTNATFVNQDTLRYLFEVYNSHKVVEDPYYFVNVRFFEGSSNQALIQYSKISKKNPQSINIVSDYFDISTLPSNSYRIQIDVMDKKYQVLGTMNRYIFVSNSRVASPVLDELSKNQAGYENIYGYTEEELDLYIETLSYISTRGEQEIAKSLETYQEKMNFFYGFWDKRRDAEDHWLLYEKRVTYANQDFGYAYRKGWQSDRGRVMLTYGKPNDLQRYHYEAGKVPYEIWFYNRLRRQNDIIFVFYDPDLIGEFRLLHSNAYEEIKNPQWKYEIVNRFEQDPDRDGSEMRYDGILGTGH